MEYSINVNSIEWQCWSGNYIITDFLPDWTVSYWKRVLKCQTKNGFVYLSFSSLSFCLICWCSFVRCIHIKDCYLSYFHGELTISIPISMPMSIIYIISLFIPDTFLCPEVHFFWNLYTDSSFFFKLIFTWYIFLIPLLLTFLNLYI